MIFIIGIVSFIFVLGPLTQAEAKYIIDRVFGVKRTVVTSEGGVSYRDSSIVKNEQRTTNNEATPSGESFSNIKPKEDQIVPVSTDYGIVIEKINANAKIIPAVNPANEKEYVAALTKGVAESLGSTPPGQPGNLYLFSHSTDAPWNIIRYNAIFYLLKELEVGDRVIIFYRNIRYDYIVFDKNIALPGDISYLTNRYENPVLTLQTCDPPGTLLNRLIIRAKLVNT